MPRILGFDLETTGLDTTLDRPIEVGICLWDTDSKKPIISRGFFLWDETYPPVQADAIKVHGITLELLKEFGEDPKDVFPWIERFIEKHSIVAVVAHNGNAFDKPLLLNELKRLQLDCPLISGLHWVDTHQDLPEYGKSKSLTYMAADHGFVNPYSHRAQFDVLAMMKILSKFDIEEVIKIGKTPKVRMKGSLSMGEQNFEIKKDWLKKRGYRWNSEKKFWEKEFKETEVDKEKQEALQAGIRLTISM